MAFLFSLLAAMHSAATEQAAKDLVAPVNAKMAPARRAAIEKTRLAALDYFGKMGPAARPHLRVICDRIVIPPTAPTTSVLDAVEKIDPKLYKPLREYVLARPADRAKAMGELRDLGEAALPAVGILAYELAAAIDKKTESAGYATLRALRWMKADKDPYVFSVVTLAAGPKNSDAALRLDAASTLIDWSEGRPERHKELISTLTEGIKATDKDLRIWSIKKAGSLGTEAVVLLESIRKLRTSGDPDVRSAADEAVEKLSKK